MNDNNNNNNDAGGVGEEIPDDDDDIEALPPAQIEEMRTDNNSNWRTFSIAFDNFEEVSSDENGIFLSSSNFSCFGHTWRIDLCPAGDDGSLDGTVAIFLHRVSEGKEIDIKYSFVIKGDTEEICFKDSRAFDENCSWGEYSFVYRSVLTDRYLHRGVLKIYVSMQLREYIPKNPASSIMLKLFGDEKSADVVFEVAGGDKQKHFDEDDDLNSSESSTQFHAHRLFLQHHSSELAALCATSEGMKPIHIIDVKPSVFRLLLYYVYGGEISEKEFVANSMDLIKAADKYGVVNLKLEAEVWYVHDTTITIDNVIDLLHYAGAMNCALLSEAVMDFIVANKEEVIRKVSFQNVPGDMYKDLLAAMTRYYEEDSEEDSEEDDDDDEDNEEDEEKSHVETSFSKMRIRDLRQKLYEKGMDVDGSRDTLIAALMEHPFK